MGESGGVSGGAPAAWRGFLRAICGVGGAPGPAEGGGALSKGRRGEFGDEDERGEGTYAGALEGLPEGRGCSSCPLWLFGGGKGGTVGKRKETEQEREEEGRCSDSSTPV